MHNVIAMEGYDVAIRAVGSGLPIVVIAGGPGLACSYLTPLMALREEHQVVIFDQPGCGDSASSVVPTADQAVEATIEVIRSVGDRFALAAHSWGGYLAARACLELSTPPIATTLFNPVPFDRSGFDIVGARLLDRVAPDVLERIVELSSLGTPDAGRELMRLAMPAYCGRANNIPDVPIEFEIATSNGVIASLGDYDVHEAANRMGNLTLVFGSTDYILASDFEAQAPNAKVVTLECGHFSVLDAPSELARIIKEGIGS